MALDPIMADAACPPAPAAPAPSCPLCLRAVEGAKTAEGVVYLRHVAACAAERLKTAEAAQGMCWGAGGPPDLRLRPTVPVMTEPARRIQRELPPQTFDLLGDPWPQSIYDHWFYRIRRNFVEMLPDVRQRIYDFRSVAVLVAAAMTTEHRGQANWSILLRRYIRTLPPDGTSWTAAYQIGFGDNDLTVEFDDDLLGIRHAVWIRDDLTYATTRETWQALPEDGVGIEALPRFSGRLEGVKGDLTFQSEFYLSTRAVVDTYIEDPLKKAE